VREMGTRDRIAFAHGFKKFKLSHGLICVPVTAACCGLRTECARSRCPCTSPSRP
jgi:hypothetical protein